MSVDKQIPKRCVRHTLSVIQPSGKNILTDATTGVAFYGSILKENQSRKKSWYMNSFLPRVVINRVESQEVEGRCLACWQGEREVRVVDPESQC